MTVTIDALLDLFEPGKMIYVPGASGEALAIRDALARRPDRARGVHFVSCFVPGMNRVDYAAWAEDARVTTFMLPPEMRGSFAAGKVRLIPATYLAAARYLAGSVFDVAIAHVAPPGSDGRCSLGIASDFAPLVWPRAKLRVLLVNPAMPAIQGAQSLAVADADLVVEQLAELVTMENSEPGSDQDSAASLAASLIPDGAHVQAGIGGAPSALWNHLHGHRGLVVRSGLVSDPVQRLIATGVLQPRGHRAGIAIGSREFYDYLAQTDAVTFAPVTETHSMGNLARLDRFHAVNSALEVDLFGQVNVEWRGPTLAGGVGGAPDFARAAMASPGGRSITVLPATARGAAVSRIVPRLGCASVGLARNEIDTVVTEFGVADLRRLDVDERAKALIAIAAPVFREELSRHWRDATGRG